MNESLIAASTGKMFSPGGFQALCLALNYLAAAILLSTIGLMVRTMYGLEEETVRQRVEELINVMDLGASHCKLACDERYFKSLESLFLYLVGGRYDMLEWL